jgi:hypothetical protein
LIQIKNAIVGSKSRTQTLANGHRSLLEEKSDGRRSIVSSTNADLIGDAIFVDNFAQVSAFDPGTVVERALVATDRLRSARFPVEQAH